MFEKCFGRNGTPEVNRMGCGGDGDGGGVKFTKLHAPFLLHATTVNRHIYNYIHANVLIYTHTCIYIYTKYLCTYLRN